MAKAIRSFSLELKTIQTLEDYCKKSDNWEKNISRSKVVNDAIVWFLTGDVAELVHNNEKLVKKFGDAMRQKDDPNPKMAWWRHILGLR